MAGQGTISVNQTPQYGDKTVLDQFKSSTTSMPMTGNPTPAPTAGRPSEGGGQPSAGAAGPLGVPAGHVEQARDVALKAWAARFWAEQASRADAGPRTRLMAQAAAKQLEEATMATRENTPFFG